MSRTTFLRALAVVLWTCLIFVFSSEPYEKQSIQPLLHEKLGDSGLLQAMPDLAITYNDTTLSTQRDPFQFVEFIFRKGAHLFMYGVLAAGWSLLLGARVRGGRLLVLVMAAVALTASLDEWNQSHVAGRYSLPSDVGIDIVGGLMGFMSVQVLNLLHIVLTRYRLYHRMETVKRGDTS
ncbi:VanZ family protein [Cohnella fermenti]|nr:VanZ family protein [Cohnella fermenti]